MADVDGGGPWNLPAGIGVITVFGQLLNSDGSPCVGTIEFTPSTAVAYTGSDVTLLAKTVAATLDTVGKFTIDLPATDDPAGNPGIDRTFYVNEKMPGGRKRNIALPLLPAVKDYADLVNVPTGEGTPTAPVVTFINVVTVDGGTP